MYLIPREPCNAGHFQLPVQLFDKSGYKMTQNHLVSLA